MDLHSQTKAKRRSCSRRSTIDKSLQKVPLPLRRRSEGANSWVTAVAAASLAAVRLTSPRSAHPLTSNTLRTWASPLRRDSRQKTSTQAGQRCWISSPTWASVKPTSRRMKASLKTLSASAAGCQSQRKPQRERRRRCLRRHQAGDQQAHASNHHPRRRRGDRRRQQ